MPTESNLYEGALHFVLLLVLVPGHVQEELLQRQHHDPWLRVRAKHGICLPSASRTVRKDGRGEAIQHAIDEELRGVVEDLRCRFTNACLSEI